VRVLIVRIGAMGDVLHAMPAVAALRAAHPDWFIGWAIEPRWSGLLQTSGTGSSGDSASSQTGRGQTMPLVDRWYQVPARYWSERPFSWQTLMGVKATWGELSRGKFDVCVDMQGSLKSAVVGRMAGARVFAGAAEPRERVARWLYKQRVGLTFAHVVGQGCELLGSAVGEALRPTRVTLPIDEADERWADGVAGRERFCLISPGAGWGAKMWPAERFGAVAAELGRAGYRTLVNASLHGSGEAERVVQRSEGFAVAVPCSVGGLTALVRRAGVVIAGDTGPLHLAAALERPVVGIYGPTDPARNGPYGTCSRVLRDAASLTSHKRVSEAEAGMLRIGVDEVVQAALEMLG